MCIMEKPKIICWNCRWFDRADYDCEHDTNISYDYRGFKEHINEPKIINMNHDCPNFEKRLPIIKRVSMFIDRLKGIEIRW